MLSSSSPRLGGAAEAGGGAWHVGAGRGRGTYDAGVEPWDVVGDRVERRAFGDVDGAARMAVRPSEPDRCVLDRHPKQKAGREQLDAPSAKGMQEARRDHGRDQEVELPDVRHIANHEGRRWRWWRKRARL